MRLIAYELVASGGGTAVALACCCKSFEDPMLDALWVVQNRLLPLLKSFPGDVWNDPDECTVSTPTTCVFPFLNNLIQKSFKRLPTTAEWSRLQKYARRMRELNDYGTLNDLSPEVFSVMQPHTINGLLLPNLNALYLVGIERRFIPFISSFLSPRITSVFFEFSGPNNYKSAIASTITTLPTLCPNLQAISLPFLPNDPMITAAVSEMLLATSRNTLRRLYIDSPLTEEASGAVCKLPGLRDLRVVTEKETSLPSALLPNLTELAIRCDDEGDWPRLFHGATFGKLEIVWFSPRSKKIGDFLGAFERAALSSSVQNTLTRFRISVPRSWIPNYSSLLPFTQMVDLDIDFSCRDECSSTVDDDIVINLSRAMPKLTVLQLGGYPCEEVMTGVTVKGLVALALYCPKLSTLRVHLQVASLIVPPAGPGTGRNTEPSVSRTVCALKELVVGKISVPKESVLMMALTLSRIFPRLKTIDAKKMVWAKVEDAIRHSKQIVDCSSKQ